MNTILVIDDDYDLLKLIRRILTPEYQVLTKDTLIDLKLAELQSADLIILDVMLPIEDGFTFLRRHRSVIDVPVLFLTAKDFEQDKLEGFASGGDDYITKPFSIQELRARVAANLRREQRTPHTRLSDPPITCDLLSCQFYIHNKALNLTSLEYEICLLLLKRRGQVFSREDIYTQIEGRNATGDSKFTITERIKKIRQKFATFNINPIQTVWGMGYKWEINP